MDALFQRADALERVPPAAVEAAAKQLLQEVEAINADDAGIKAQQLMVLKGRIKTLSGSQSLAREGELEISRALKMHNTNSVAWICLSDAQWRRGALREALDAADSAVRCDGDNAKALAQLSAVARANATSRPDLDAAARASLRASALDRGRAAVSKAPDSAHCWLTLALAVTTDAACTGMRIADARKALAACAQATRLDPQNGDALLNRGLIEHTLMMFADAAVSFQRVLSAPDQGLAGAATSALQRSIAMMRMLQQRARLDITQLRDSVPKKTFIGAIARGQMQRPTDTTIVKWGEATEPQQKQQQQPEAAASTAGAAAAATAARPLLLLVALRRISGTADVPLVFECLDQEASRLVALAVTGLAPGAIPVPDVDPQGRIDVNATLPVLGVFCPPAELLVLPQTLSAAAKKEAATAGKAAAAIETMTASNAPLHCVWVDGNNVLINGAPPAAEHIVAPQVSTTRSA